MLTETENSYSPVKKPAENNDNINPVPEKNMVKEKVVALVNTDLETTFDFIASGSELSLWLKKYGAISAEKTVEVIKGPYTFPGAKRKVTFENGGSVQEELLSYNPPANYSYRVTQFSNFLKRFTDAAYVHLWFDKADEKTRITWDYGYTYKNFLGRIVLWLFCSLVFKKYMQHCLDNAQTILNNNPTNVNQPGSSVLMV